MNQSEAAPLEVFHASGDSPVDDPLLCDLTEPQMRAVLHEQGALLVLAAAGSGKTRVITRRIAHLITTGVAPWSVLALTFTNKAAGEMRDRVHHLLDPEGSGKSRLVRGLTITTFHSLCARLLRRYVEQAQIPGLTGDYTIYNSDDQSSVIKRVLKRLDLNGSNWPPASVRAVISDAKNQLIDAETYQAQAGDFYSKNLARVYEAYQAELRKANAVDFDDLLMLTARMLLQHEHIRAECQNRWEYLLVDEYQDTNHAQFLLANLIAGEGSPNICVVGDPDQSIYGWRGADITNILDFEKSYTGARVITLGENFRSTEPILAAADRLIRNNQQRRHKDLFTTTPGGGAVQVVLCQNEQHESDIVVDWFKAFTETESPLAWKEMAVFYRTNALSRSIEDAFRASGVPYVIARGTSFYEREEIRHALAYLRITANETDDAAFRRIVNVPTRGLGATSITRIENYAHKNNLSTFRAMRSIGQVPGLTARAVNSAQRFVELIDDLSGGGTFMGEQISGSLADLVQRVIQSSGLEKMYADRARIGKAESDLERPDNLAELISSAAQFEQEYVPENDPSLDVPVAEGRAEPPPLLVMLRAYLESVSLVADADMVDPERGAVTLMTLHAAKGLEFPAVAMIGLEEGILPHFRSRERIAALEEERRLCFVGITRAQRHLLITSARYRTMRGVQERTIASPFVDEISGPGVTFSDQADEVVSSPRRSSSYSGQSDPALVEFPVGTVVRHPRFGIGQVTWTSAGENAKARVRFSSVGEKTLILEYARLVRVGS